MQRPPASGPLPPPGPTLPALPSSPGEPVATVDPEDLRILEDYAEGRVREGFDRLARAYLPRIRVIVQRRLFPFSHRAGLRESAEDIVQDALLRVDASLRRQPDVRVIRRLDHWIWRTVIWEVQSAILRACRLEAQEVSLEPAAPGRDPLEPTDTAWDEGGWLEADIIEGLEQSHRLRSFHQCAGELNARTAQVLRLWLLGLTLKEIARRVGYAYLTAAAKARERALELIAGCLRTKGFEVPSSTKTREDV